jgi:transposase
MLALDPRVFEPVWQTAKSLVTGASWDTVGRLVGVSESTLLRRRTEWQRAGVFTQLAELALSAYDTMIGLRLDEISIDGSVHKAPMGGEGTGPSPVDRGKRGWKWSMASDGSGVPIAWVPGAANTPDTRLLDDTLDVLDARGFEIEIEQAHLDRGYDAVAVRDGFAESGIDAHIVHRAKHVRGRKYGSRARNKVPLGRRWKVERANSWLSNFGQLRRNTDRKPIQREAAMDLAVTFVITVKLIKWRQRYGNTIHHPHQLTY